VSICFRKKNHSDLVFLVRKVCFCFTKGRHFGVKTVSAGLSDECFESTHIEDMCFFNPIFVKDNVNNDDDDLMGQWVPMLQCFTCPR